MVRSMMVNWFTFGGVRGVFGSLMTSFLGSLVASYFWKFIPTNYAIALTFSLRSVLPNFSGIENLAAPPEIAIGILVFSLASAFLYYGYVYWLGAQTANWLQTRYTYLKSYHGMQRAVLVGVIGSVILVVVFLSLMLFFIMYLVSAISQALGEPIDLTPQVVFEIWVIGVLIGALVTAILEIPFAIVTSIVYNVMGWDIPNVGDEDQMGVI